ncbi:hypothetical protein MNEG_3494 [Monoraphidium neglectum]|uniref:Uncharacterized protein n=1 Tax=Monoraphidium neglectum TaxID=145388 RepID=A0A0D2K1I3_9CHLO|nr:hypothetical protein MNEG_3494 [Monoraphidium neglectum]KIZ04463.1 hypothetical protein MNEG_3494 [Monoraphidium neglectum]|eukprot:XP_013903482.1 hypothetical protein MNEG_3494 [Monoraphidium neglectum]
MADERRELLQEIRREIASPAPLDRAPSPAASTAYSGYSGSPSYSTAFGGYGSPSMVAGPPPPLSAVTRASIWDPAGGALGGAGESLAAPCRSSVFAGEATVGRLSFVPPLPGHGPAYSSVGVLSATAPVRASSMYHASLPMPPAPTNSLVRAASASAAQPELGAAKFVPQPLDPGAFRWTSKYLQGNDRMRDVVTTLLELAFMPPHRALHTGKVSITIASECTHDRMMALLGSTMSEGSSLRDKLQVISVKGSSGWAFEMALRPGSELALFEKYSVAEYVQDNWFVLAAILKDE